MGTENDLDVEGQTEPPIRGLTRSRSVSAHSTTNPPSASPTLAGTVITDDSPQNPALDPDAAHTLPIAGVCALLITDVEYV